MNVQVLQENLNRILNQTGRIISTKSQLPVLQTVFLKAKEGMIIATSTNLETSEIVGVGAKVVKEGEVCVPAKLFAELIGSLPQETVALVDEDGGLTVKCAGFSAVIPVMPTGEFPAVDVSNQGKKIILAKDLLTAALGEVLFATATDEARPLLAGLKIKTADKELLLAATDGYRLAVKRLQIDLETDLDIVVPARALGEVLKVAHEEKGATEVSLIHASDGQLVFGVGETRVVTRLIDGEYPNFEKIIPKSHTTRVRFETETLLKAVRSASIFARDNANIIRLSVDDQQVVVSANTPSVGENKVEVGAQVDGDGGVIAFNCRFLLEFLANFKGEEVLFEMTGALNPGVFRPTSDLSYLHIIMPVRVQD